MAAAVGCGASGDEQSDRGLGDRASSGTDGGVNLPSALTFEPDSTLELVPGAQRTIAVRAVPPGVYRVRFALLGPPAGTKDASLDRSEVDTDADGLATVRLTAPTSPTFFRFRASIGTELAAETAVSVSGNGFAVIQVKPTYAGRRHISYWVASVSSGATCDSLPAGVLDGDLIGQAVAGQTPKINSVPIGVPLAVRLRAGYLATGCAPIEKLVRDDVNLVEISVRDVPLQLGGLNLGVTLGVEKVENELHSVLDTSIADALSAMLAGARDDVDALLDAMGSNTASASAASSFQAARTQKNWHDLLLPMLGGTAAPKLLRTQLQTWMKAGVNELNTPTAFQGSLTTAGKEAGLATLELSAIAGNEPSQAGFSRINTVSWTADPGDTLLLGANESSSGDMRLRWVPSRLVTALATSPARSAVLGASGVAEALARVVNCQAIAAVLSSNGVKPGEAYAGCTVACAKSLCEAGFVSLWERARDASMTNADTATLSINATGPADIREQPRPVGFVGSWVGSLLVDSSMASLGGPARGGIINPPN